MDSNEDMFVALVNAKAEVDLRLSDFAPRSELKLTAHRIEKPRFPVIDYHNHLDSQSPQEVLRIMDECDVEKIVNITMQVGQAALDSIERFRLAAPDRFARFVLMNTAAFRMPKCPWPIHLCHLPGFGPLAVQGLNLFVRAALRTTVCKHERMTPAVKAGYLAPYDSWAHRVAVLRFVLDIPLSAKHPSYQTLTDIERGLARLRQHPMCFIWGMRDWCFTPQFLARFLDFFPEAEVHRLADAGHYAVEDAHEPIAPLVEDFVQRHPLP